jgi:hypothetical protein
VFVGKPLLNLVAVVLQIGRPQSLQSVWGRLSVSLFHWCQGSRTSFLQLSTNSSSETLSNLNFCGISRENSPWQNASSCWKVGQADFAVDGSLRRLFGEIPGAKRKPEERQ